MQKNPAISTSDKNQTSQSTKMAEAGLNFLLNDPEELLRFMNVSGYNPNSLRASIATPELDMAIISYLAANEPALLAMCANSKINISSFMSCWHQLENQT